MNGWKIPKTPICVDYWRGTIHQRHRKIFFLSHMHADHTAGLTPSWRHPIYCSEVSAKLLKAKFNIDSQYIRPLALNQDHVIPVNRNCDDTMTVSLIDANHCPGSVMYIFEGYFGRIIYTGDFRYTPDMFVSTPLADLCKNPADECSSQDSESTFIGEVVTQPVDALYLDNTYCNPGGVVPSREVAKQQIIDIIEKHPGHNVLLGMHTLGKEELLVDLALHFKTWVIVDAKRYESLKLLDLPDVFSTDPSDELRWIRVVAQNQVSKMQMRRWNETVRTIGILPTGFYTGSNFKPYANQNFFIIPYSDHSSYSELHKFVSRIRPRKIIPVVPANTRGVFGMSFSDRANMQCFDHYIDSTSPLAFDLPKWLCNMESMYATEQDTIIKAGGKKRKRPVRKSKKMSTARGVVYEDSPEQTLSIANRVPQMGHLQQDTEKELVSRGSDRSKSESVSSHVSSTTSEEKVCVLKVVEDSPHNTEETITVEIMMNESSDACSSSDELSAIRMSCYEGDEGYQLTTETATLEKASKEKGCRLMPFDGVDSKQNPKWKKIKLTEDLSLHSGNGFCLTDGNCLHCGLLSAETHRLDGEAMDCQPSEIGDDTEDIVESEEEVQTKQRSFLHQESHQNANMNSNNKTSELTVEDSLASANDDHLHPKRNGKIEKPISTAINESSNANKQIVNSIDKNKEVACTAKVIDWLKKHQNVPKSCKPDNSDSIIGDSEEEMEESEPTIEISNNIWPDTQYAFSTCAQDDVQPLVSDDQCLIVNKKRTMENTMINTEELFRQQETVDSTMDRIPKKLVSVTPSSKQIADEVHNACLGTSVREGEGKRFEERGLLSAKTHKLDGEAMDCQPGEIPNSSDDTEDIVESEKEVETNQRSILHHESHKNPKMNSSNKKSELTVDNSIASPEIVEQNDDHLRPTRNAKTEKPVIIDLTSEDSEEEMEESETTMAANHNIWPDTQYAFSTCAKDDVQPLVSADQCLIVNKKRTMENTTINTGELFRQQETVDSTMDRKPKKLVSLTPFSKQIVNEVNNACLGTSVREGEGKRFEESGLLSAKTHKLDEEAMDCPNSSDDTKDIVESEQEVETNQHSILHHESHKNPKMNSSNKKSELTVDNSIASPEIVEQNDDHLRPTRNAKTEKPVIIDLTSEDSEEEMEESETTMAANHNIWPDTQYAFSTCAKEDVQPLVSDDQCLTVNKERKIENTLINKEELFRQQETVDSTMDRIALTPSFEQTVNEVHNECLVTSVHEGEGEEKRFEESGLLSVETHKLDGEAMGCQLGKIPNSIDDKQGSKMKCNKNSSKSDCTIDENYSCHKIKQLPKSVTSKSRFPNRSLAPIDKLQPLSWPARLKKFSSINVKLQTGKAYSNTSKIECTATSTNCTPGQYKNTVKSNKLVSVTSSFEQILNEVHNKCLGTSAHESEGEGKCFEKHVPLSAGTYKLDGEAVDRQPGEIPNSSDDNQGSKMKCNKNSRKRDCNVDKSYSYQKIKPLPKSVTSKSQFPNPSLAPTIKLQTLSCPARLKKFSSVKVKLQTGIAYPNTSKIECTATSTFGTPGQYKNTLKSNKPVSVMPSCEQILNEVHNKCLGTSAHESEGEGKCFEKHVPLSAGTHKLDGEAVDRQPGEIPNSSNDNQGSKMKCNKNSRKRDCNVDKSYSYQKIKPLPKSVTSKSQFLNPSLAPTIKLQTLSCPARLKKFSSVKVKLQTGIAYPNTSKIECTATSTFGTPGQYKNTLKSNKPVSVMPSCEQIVNEVHKKCMGMSAHESEGEEKRFEKCGPLSTESHKLHGVAMDCQPSEISNSSDDNQGSKMKCNKKSRKSDCTMEESYSYQKIKRLPQSITSKSRFLNHSLAPTFKLQPPSLPGRLKKFSSVQTFQGPQNS